MPERYPQIERPRTPDLRASDGDRDAVADILRAQHLAGRLQTDEFQERIDRCYEARTYGELDALVADLPRAESNHPVRLTWRWPVVAVLPLVIAAAAVSHGHLLWLAFPFFFFVWRPLLWRHGWGGAAWGPRHGPPPGSYV